MKCPKCGYHSFEHLDDCKKCGQSLAEHKAKFNLKGFFSPGHAVATVEAVTADAVPEPDVSEEASGDFGFDFLEEAEGQGVADSPLDEENANISIDQPFGVDAESVPADDFATNFAADDKSEKGSEFSF